MGRCLKVSNIKKNALIEEWGQTSPDVTKTIVKSMPSLTKVAPQAINSSYNLF